MEGNRGYIKVLLFPVRDAFVTIEGTEVLSEGNEVMSLVCVALIRLRRIGVPNVSKS